MVVRIKRVHILKGLSLCLTYSIIIIIPLVATLESDWKDKTSTHIHMILYVHVYQSEFHQRCKANMRNLLQGSGLCNCGRHIQKFLGSTVRKGRPKLLGMTK